MREGFLRKERSGSRIKGIALFPRRPERRERADKYTCEVPSSATKATEDTCSLIGSQKTEQVKRVLAKQTLGKQVIQTAHQRWALPKLFHLLSCSWVVPGQEFSRRCGSEQLPGEKLHGVSCSPGTPSFLCSCHPSIYIPQDWLSWAIPVQLPLSFLTL